MRILICTLVVLFATCSARSQTIEIDDFHDGTDDGWSHSGNLGLGAPGKWDASSGAYNLSSSGPISPAGEGMNSIWSKSSEPIFNHGFLRAKVRANTAASEPGLGMRGTFDTGGYFFTSSPFTNEFSIRELNLNGDSGILARWHDPSVSFNHGEDWWFEAGAVGAQLSFRFWRDGDAEPAEPQLTVTDDSLATGQFGVSASVSNSSPTPELLDVTFDDFTFRVPEPSAFCLFGLAFFGLILQRKRSVKGR